MNQETVLKLALDDLKPQEIAFEISTRPGKTYTLAAYTLRRQIWAAKRFGAKELEASIASQNIIVLSELGWDLLKEKNEFKNFDEFLDAFLSYKDRKVLSESIMATMGLSQPVLQRLADQLDDVKKQTAQSPDAEQIGANSSTPLPSPTAGPLINS